MRSAPKSDGDMDLDGPLAPRDECMHRRLELEQLAQTRHARERFVRPARCPQQGHVGFAECDVEVDVVDVVILRVHGLRRREGAMHDAEQVSIPLNAAS